jgi:hypothetical protein
MAQRRGGSDQNRRHDELRQDRSKRRVGARHAKVGDSDLFLDDGGLLVKHHPGHDHRADIGGDQI